MRKSLASLIMGVSILLASLSWTGFVILRTTLNANRSEIIAEELVENEAVRALVVDRASSNIHSQLPERLQGTVSKQLIEGASKQALENEVLESILTSGLTRMHQRLLEGDFQDVDLNLTATSQERQELTSALDLPEQLVPEDLSLDLSIPTSGLNIVSTVKNTLEIVAPIGALLAFAGASIALFIAKDRAKLLRRVAYWAFGAAAFWLVMGLLVPQILDGGSPEASAIASAIVTIFFAAMISPALALAGLGLGLLVLSYLWPKHQRNRKLDTATGG